VRGITGGSPDFSGEGVHNEGDTNEQPGGVQDPMNIAAKIRARRAEARTRRAVNRAIDMAATPAMRHELIMIAQAQHGPLR
jgi:hypothetical protein